MAKRVTVTTVEELDAFFGGPKLTAEAMAVTPQIVCEWKRRGMLPARLYFRQRQILRTKGVNAMPSLWGFAEAEGAAA